MDVTPILTELPIEEADRKILENLLKKADGQTPPLESLSETGAKVLFNLAINKVRICFSEERWIASISSF